jgi:hypothetical protein
MTGVAFVALQLRHVGIPDLFRLDAKIVKSLFLAGVVELVH